MASAPARERGGFPYCLALAVLIAVFVFVLDMNYRSDAILKYLPFGWLVVNGALVLLLALAGAGFLAVALWGLDGGARRLLPRIPEGCAAFTLAWLVLAYANALYFKFFDIGRQQSWSVVMTGSMRKGEIMLGILVLLTPLAWRRFNPDAMAGISKHIARVTLMGAIFCLGLVVLGAVLSSKPTPASPPTAASKPHVILVTFDALSAGHVSGYGYSRPTTPHLDALAQSSYVFEHMETDINTTYGALQCMLGRYARAQPEDGAPVMAGAMRDAGYAQRILILSQHVSKRLRQDWTRVVECFAFDFQPAAAVLRRVAGEESIQWFSDLASEDARFVDLFSWRDPRDTNGILKQPFPTDQYFERAVQALKTSSGPTFIWMHMFEPHSPYVVPEPYYSHFGSAIADHYDGAVEYADAQLGVFIDRLRAEGLWDHCILVVSTDHGEGHGEYEIAGRRCYFHGCDWQDEAVDHIPLIIHTPGQTRGVHVQTYAETVDLAPTLVALVGGTPPAWMEGESLLPYMQAPERLSTKLKLAVPNAWMVRQYASMLVTDGDWLWNDVDMFSAYVDRYKIGYAQRYHARPNDPSRIDQPFELDFYGVYDLHTDPDERHNLMGDPKVTPLVERVFRDPLTQFYHGPAVTRWGRGHMGLKYLGHPVPP